MREIMENIIPFYSEEPNKKNTLELTDEILSELGSKRARNIPIDIFEIVSLLDEESDSLKIRDWLVSQRVCTRADWQKALNCQQIKTFLGRYPKSATEYLQSWIDRHGIIMDYKCNIRHRGRVIHEGEDVAKEIEQIKQELTKSNPKESARLNQRLRLFQDILNCKSPEITTEDLSRDMRIKAKELNLSYNSHDIEDVIHSWVKSEQPNRKFEIFSELMYRSDLAKTDTWHNMIKAVFDISEMPEEVIIAAIKKFIWQVKRKIQNIDVTNHLMTVILGPQGVGKSTWMNRLIAPLREMTASTDFRQITDDRNINLWNNFVLVLDEMGYASKADVESVKNVISAPLLLRRVMKTNSTINVRQQSTFIGASNREIDQLIRDETGNRRFIGLRFSKTPNWKVMNQLDFRDLWQSVDETASDPLLPYMSYMQEAQEINRCMTSCEEWVYSLPNAYKSKDYQGGTIWYKMYKDWERDHYDKKRLDFDEWGKELRRLIKNTSDFPFIFMLRGRGYSYKFNGNPKQQI
jgi:hypothetical protein